jgi:hypothetical protein
MSTALETAEKLLDPEKAIEMAAGLQRLGVAQNALLDPLKLMDMAQNDPAELQNQMIKMSEQFVHMSAAGRFEILPGAKRQMNEIAREIGIGVDEFARMAVSSAELNKKMQEISFPSDIVDEEERKFIANMAEIGKTGKYEVSFVAKDDEGRYNEVTKSIDQLTEQDREQLRIAQKKKPIEEIAMEQLDIEKATLGQIQALNKSLTMGVASAPVGTTITEGLRTGFKTMGKLAEPMDAKFSRQTTQFMSEKGLDVLSSLPDMLKGGFDMSKMGEFLEKIQQSGGEFDKEILGPKKKEMMDNAIVIMSELMQNPNFLKTKETLGDPIMDIIKDTIKGVFPESDLEKLFSITTPENNPQPTAANMMNPALGNMGSYANNNQPQMMGSSELTVNFNLNLTSNSPNIDANTLKQVMDQEMFRQTVIAAIDKAVKDGKTGIPPKEPNFG